MSVDGFWRKRRGGIEYGSWHTWGGGKIVNLKTLSLDEAKVKARSLSAAAGFTPPRPPSEEKPAAAGFSAAPPPRRRRSPIRSWAVAEGGERPPPVAPTPAPAPPQKPELTPGMIGLAAGLAGTLARFNALAVAITCRLMRKGSKTPELDEGELRQLEKTYDEGLKEMFLLQGVKWWHVLALQNGMMAMRMYDEATPAPPATLRPVPHASAP